MSRYSDKYLETRVKYEEDMHLTPRDDEIQLRMKNAKSPILRGGTHECIRHCEETLSQNFPGLSPNSINFKRLFEALGPEGIKHVVSERLSYETSLKRFDLLDFSRIFEIQDEVKKKLGTTLEFIANGKKSAGRYFILDKLIEVYGHGDPADNPQELLESLLKGQLPQVVRIVLHEAVHAKQHADLGFTRRAIQRLLPFCGIINFSLSQKLLREQHAHIISDVFTGFCNLEDARFGTIASSQDFALKKGEEVTSPNSGLQQKELDSFMVMSALLFLGRDFTDDIKISEISTLIRKAALDESGEPFEDLNNFVRKYYKRVLGLETEDEISEYIEKRVELLEAEIQTARLDREFLTKHEIVKYLQLEHKIPFVS